MTAKAQALRDEYAAAPWVVFDATDEYYLAAEKWVDDLWEAQIFSRDSAAAAAKHHGGAEVNVFAEPYAWHDLQPKDLPDDRTG